MSETRKLYYEDVYTKEFTANVLECREGKKGYEIIYNCSKHCAEHTLHLNPSLVVSGG